MWKANKYLSILLWVLGGLSAFVCVYVFIRCGQLDPINQKEELSSVLSPLFIWTVALIGLAAVLAIGLPLPALFRNPKAALTLLGYAVAFCAVIGISYLMSSDEPLPFNPGHVPVSSGELIMAGINITAVTIMLVLTILVTIAMSVWNMIKMK